MKRAGEVGWTSPPAVTASAMVSAVDVTRTFGHGDTAVPALRWVSFAIPRGQLTALSGRSGSGKRMSHFAATRSSAGSRRMTRRPISSRGPAGSRTCCFPAVRASGSTARSRRGSR